MLKNAEEAYGTASLSVAAWIDVAVPAATLAVVVVTALVPALRAGRLSAVEAIVVGRTPRAGRGRFARRVLTRLPVPRPLSLGLAGPFARPVRALAVGAAIVFGATAVTFAVGLVSSLHAVSDGLHRDNTGVTVMTDAGFMGPRVTTSTSASAANPAAVAAAISAQPGTASFYGTGMSQATVSGITGAINVQAFQGDASGAYEMISGNWFTGPGQAVVPTEFFQLSGAHLGDTVTIAEGGRSIQVRLVGEVFDTGNDGRELLTDVSTLGTAAPGARIDQFDITLKPDTNADGYRSALDNALQPIGAGVLPSSKGGGGSELAAMDAMIVLLTLMLVAVAGLGVLNSVVLDTRERVHDLGVYKAIGMTPRQTIGMVVTSVAGIGLVAGVIGVPLGIALHDYILPTMGHAAGTNLPHAVVAVYHGSELVLLGLGGVAIAVLGALLPASWAARTRTATALRTE
jgi:putative ABC transport system permease protein